MKSLNCWVAPYDLLRSSSDSCNRKSPCLDFTRDKTLYSQFLQQSSPYAVIMIFSSFLPYSLWPVTASARLMGNCDIIVLNLSGGVFLFILHLTDVPKCFAVIWNIFYLILILFFVVVGEYVLGCGRDIALLSVSLFSFFICEVLSITSNSIYWTSLALVVVTFLPRNILVLSDTAFSLTFTDLNWHIVPLPRGTVSDSALLSVIHINLAP